jgi:hypothetical protein
MSDRLLEISNRILAELHGELDANLDDAISVFICCLSYICESTSKPSLAYKYVHDHLKRYENYCIATSDGDLDDG